MEDSSMSGFTEFDQYDGMGLAELVRRREVSPDEVLEAAIARVEARNPAVNAVVARLYDEARAAIRAGLPARPFTGVPYPDSTEFSGAAIQARTDSHLRRGFAD
jgi:hypothetical protein